MYEERHEDDSIPFQVASTPVFTVEDFRWIFKFPSYLQHLRAIVFKEHFALDYLVHLMPDVLKERSLMCISV